MSSTLQLIDGVWHGHTESSCMSMSQDTFQRYVSAYMQRVSGKPTPMQEEAMQHVTRLSYWAYARCDRHIRFVRLPGCILAGNKGEREEENIHG